MPDIPADDVTILIATGTHRTNTPAELETDARRGHRAPLSRRQPRQPRSRVARVRRHDHDRRAGLPESCVDERGRPDHDRVRRAAFLRRLQRRAEDGGARASRGSRRCSCCTTPGGSATRTRPGASPRAIPIHDDVREIARMVGVDFSVDVTLNREQKITAVFAGDLFAGAPRRLRGGEARRDAGGRRAVRRRADHAIPASRSIRICIRR